LYIERAVPLSRVKVDETSQVVDAHSSFIKGWRGRRCSDSGERGRESNGVWVNGKGANGVSVKVGKRRNPNGTTLKRRRSHFLCLFFSSATKTRPRF